MRRLTCWLSFVLDLFAVWTPLAMCVLCLAAGLAWGNPSLRIAGAISLLIVFAGWFFTRGTTRQEPESPLGNSAVPEGRNGMAADGRRGP